jgi:hypothetical protein
MHTVPITSLEMVFFVGLLLAWGSFLVGGFVFGKPVMDGASLRRMPLWSRMMASATLMTAAWFWFTMTLGMQANSLALWIAPGMTACFIGDLFMARVFPVRQHILAGMTAFAIGHVCYISGLWQAGEVLFAADTVAEAGSRWLPLIIWLLVGLVGWLVFIFPARKRNMLHYAALPYSLLLAGTAGVAWSLALVESAFLPGAIGAALFLLSDLLLGVQLFRHVQFRYIGDYVWLLYSPGQMLIVCGVLLHTLLLTG